MLEKKKIIKKHTDDWSKILLLKNAAFGQAESPQHQQKCYKNLLKLEGYSSLSHKKINRQL